MKLFCAYALTGEDLGPLTERMRLVVDTLNAGGHEAYCNLFDEEVMKLHEQNDVKAIFQTAFKHIKQSDALVAVVASPNRSVGQIMEIGTALSHNKPAFLFEHGSAAGSSYLPQLVDKHFSWDTLDDLRDTLKQLEQ